MASTFVVRIVAPALRSIDPRLREAAAVLGATPRRVWQEVDLPLVLRASASQPASRSPSPSASSARPSSSPAATGPPRPSRSSGSSAGRAPSTRDRRQPWRSSSWRSPRRRCCWRTGSPSGGDALSALRTEELAVAFDGVQALARVELELADGERLAVLGPSGSGKSTLLRVIAGLQRPDAGSGAARRRRRHGGSCAQARRRADVPGRRAVPAPRRRGERLLRAAHRGAPAAARADRVAWALALVGLDGYERRPSPRSRAASASASPWRVRSRPIRGCCCSTSRSAYSTGRSASVCSPTSRRSSSSSGAPSRR